MKSLNYTTLLALFAVAFTFAAFTTAAEAQQFDRKVKIIYLQCEQATEATDETMISVTNSGGTHRIYDGNSPYRSMDDGDRWFNPGPGREFAYNSAVGGSINVWEYDGGGLNSNDDWIGSASLRYLKPGFYNVKLTGDSGELYDILRFMKEGSCLSSFVYWDSCKSR